MSSPSLRLISSGTWTSGPVDGGTEPPDNGAMEARVAKLEAIVPTLATKEDLLRLEAKMHQEFNSQTWKFVTWMTGVCGLLVASTYFIATHLSK